MKIASAVEGPVFIYLLRMTRIFFATAMLLSTAVCSAQIFGGFPPSTRWQLIKTDTVRVIYEKISDSAAQDVAAIIHRMNRENPNPLGARVRPIPVVLHKNTTLANGYVALGPFRSEYYLIPNSNIFEFGTTPWQQLLAVHEYRHVHQYSNFNKGVSKVASVLFGQEGQAGFNNLSIPTWFFEGDAVLSETIETGQGRGRAPWFFNNFKSIWHEGRDYSWMKLRNGSLKDLVPNDYHLGYLLVNYGYLKYGPDFWRKVTDDALRIPGVFRLFGGNVGKNAGVKWTDYIHNAFDFYKHEVSTRRDAVRRRETVTDYFFPQAIGRDSVLYVKSSFRKLPAFYLRTSEGERRIKLRHLTSEDWFSYRAGTVAYTAYNTSARWLLTNYSNIVLLDLATGAETRITDKAKYFTPDISPNGERLLAVAYTDSLTSELHLLDRQGIVLQKISAPTGALYVHPRFINADEFVVGVRYPNSTMSLEKGLLSAQRFQPIIPRGAPTLGYPWVAGNKLYFVSSHSGNDEVYEADMTRGLPVKEVRQLTSAETGNYFPSVAGDTLLYSHFTSNGHRIQSASVSGTKGLAVPMEKWAAREVPFPIALRDSASNVLADNNRRFSTTPYKKTTGLFNLHSYRPNFTDPEVSFTLYSDNVLSTFSNELFYRYNLNERSNAVGFGTAYGGLLPVLTAGVDYTFNREVKSTRGDLTFNQFEGRFGYNVPLNFNGGKTFKLLNFGSNFVYNNLIPTGATKNLLPTRSTTYLHHFATFTQQLPRARQHIFPKAGYLLNLQHRHLLSENGFQFLAGSTVYLPSIRNHSIVLAGNWQETDTANVTFSNRFANSRGYNDYYFSRMWRLSGNYHMPLLYPDWGALGGLIYFLRIRSNAFYDYTKVYSGDKTLTANQRSVGGELYFDTRMFNSIAITVGVRVSHLLDNDFSGTRPKGTNRWELIVPLNLIPQ